MSPLSTNRSSHGVKIHLFKKTIYKAQPGCQKIGEKNRQRERERERERERGKKGKGRKTQTQMMGAQEGERQKKEKKRESNRRKKEPVTYLTPSSTHKNTLLPFKACRPEPLQMTRNTSSNTRAGNKHIQQIPRAYLPNTPIRCGVWWALLLLTLSYRVPTASHFWHWGRVGWWWWGGGGAGIFSALWKVTHSSQPPFSVHHR